MVWDANVTMQSEKNVAGYERWLDHAFQDG